MWSNLLVPREGLVDYRVFFGSSSVAGETFQQYTRPSGASLLMAICVGAGGGGGNGHTGDGAGGGGGGGSAAISRLIIPWRFLPQTLFLHIPNATPAATTGLDCRILVSPDTQLATANHLLIASGGGLGGSGTGAAAGTAGSGGAAAAATTGPWLGIGFFVSVAGQNGGAGGTPSSATGGTGITPGSSGIFVSSGCGGASATSTENQSAGAGITGAGPFPTIAGGAIGTVGNAGYDNRRFMLFSGGTGGGSSAAGAGGDGGAGAPGCGGAGAGGGETAGGTGGKGGPGFVILASW